MINITLKHMYGTSVFRLARISSVRYKSDSTKKLLEFLAEMPKANTKRISEAQQQRQTISKKGEKYGPSTVYLQVLGSGARGVPNTLYLFTDQKRYLFNCGECTQRLAHEHKVKLSRLEHIFITSKTWKNIGGLPGLSLTLQDVGVPKITLHGPDGLDELYNATKRFVIMKEMQVTMAPSNPSEDFQDSVMNVKYVLLPPQVSLLQELPPKPCKRARLGEVPSPVYDQFTHDDTDYYTRGEPDTDAKKARPRHPRSPGAEQREKKKTEKVLNDLKMKKHCSVAYICTLKKRLGTLDLAKCVEKGVPPGPLLGQLKSGHDVVLSDGTIVLSRDVKTPDDPGPVFIVIELPDISYLNETEFTAHFDNGVNPSENIPTLIVHMSPPEVFHHNAYKAFMAKFGPSTRHLLLNSQNSCLGSEAVHRTQHKLHLLDPEVFPLLKDPSVPAEWSTHPPIPKSNSPVKLKGFEDLKNRIAMAQFQNIINSESVKGDETPEDMESAPKLETYSSRTLTMFHLRPKRQIDRSAEPKLHIQDYYQETMDVDGFVASLEQFRALVHDVRYAKNPSMKEYPKIVFLGTGSCIPSKTRNTSGIIVHVDDQTTILLDCGEGTFGQLVRFYGPRRVDELLRTLKAIYISHLHADHHIGLIGVLQARAAAFVDVPEKNIPVLLMAPGQIVTWLTMYDQQFEKICGEFSLIPNQNLMENAKDPGLTPAMLERIGLEVVQTCLVPHCPNAFGVAITAAGHKITYSGDTLPTQNLVKIGENSTILIHEATMEDELAEEARIKMHSTTSQAIDIGRAMNAKYTLLTHFSQRYARLPRLNAHILNDNNTVGIAFDNMQVTLSDLPLLPHMYAPLQLMFAEHCVDMELKAATRERRRERRNSSSSLASETVPDVAFIATVCAGDETVTHRSAHRRSKSRCGSKSSSRTRSLTRRDSDSSRDEHAKSLANARDCLKLSGKSSTILNWKSRTVRRESDDANRDKTPNKDVRHAEPLPNAFAPRYRDTLASRLRRKSSGTSSCNLVCRSGTPPVHTSNYRKPTSPATPLDSKSTTPRTPSPETPITHSPVDDQIPRAVSNAELSKNAQEFLWAVSNPPCSIASSRAKTITYDTKRLAERSDDTRKNRPRVCKTYMMVASCKEGYGRPLIKSTSKKLIIRKYPTPPITTSAYDVSPDACKTKSSTIRSCKADTGGPSFARVISGVGGNKNGGVRSPSRSDPGKKYGVNTKYSNIPVPTQRFCSSVNAARPLPSSHNILHRRPSKPPPLIESDLKTSSSPKVSRKMIKTSSVSCNSKANTNGGFSPTKSFKPQLEDIKSSYLLLNQNEQQNNKSDDSKPGQAPRAGDNKKRTKKLLLKAQTSYTRQLIENIPRKPEPVNENMRKMMLRDTKKKYQSKQYRCRSRYEKIEGLNWISWTQ